MRNCKKHWSCSERKKKLIYLEVKKPPASRIVSVKTGTINVMKGHHSGTPCSLLVASWVSRSINSSFATSSRGIPTCFNTHVTAALVLNGYCVIRGICRDRKHMMDDGQYHQKGKGIFFS